jgi:hypothetical protein
VKTTADSPIPRNLIDVAKILETAEDELRKKQRSTPKKIVNKLDATFMFFEVSMEKSSSIRS